MLCRLVWTSFWAMRVIKTVAAMRRQVAVWKRAGAKTGLVPTMGFLHAGHLSLVERARREVGRRGIVVVSVYVNPTQFGPQEDFARYPRALKRDLALCRAAGVDAVFAPADVEMYPGRDPGEFSTFVEEGQLSQRMEGASRPGHFRGVTTVVAKLFNMAQPDIAVFGAKDFQQAAIIRRMVRDLNFPLKIVVAPTVRERDGLALSSRNQYLAGDHRKRALVLWRSLSKASGLVRSSKTISAARLKGWVKGWIEAEPVARLDYVEFFDPATLAPVVEVRRGTQMALAVFVGKTRLIDNARM